MTLEQADKIVEPARFVTIGSRRPSFSWQVNESRSDVMQTACRILLASSLETLATDSADLWDSGVIPGRPQRSRPVGRARHWSPAKSTTGK